MSGLPEMVTPAARYAACRAFNAAEILALASGDAVLPLRDSLIFSLVCSESLDPLRAADNSCLHCSLSFRPASDSLIRAWCSGDFFLPRMVADIFARAWSLCFIPSWLPAMGQQLKPYRLSAAFMDEIQKFSRSNNLHALSTSSSTTNSNACSPCLFQAACRYALW